MEKIYPEFSIVVPTYRRELQLSSLLHALRELDYPRSRFQVIVVDDGGGVDSDVLAPFRTEMNVRLLAQENAGPAKARNTGAAQSEGQYLAFTDDDCAPSTHWLQALADHFKVNPACGVGGRTVNVLGTNTFSCASQLLLDYVYDHHNVDPQRATFFASNNLSVPADTFRELGGFDTSFPQAAGEDREFCDRWVRRGYILQYEPEALLYHAHSLSMKTFLRQHFNYGVGAFTYHSIRANCGVGQFRPELKFYLNLLHYPYSQLTWTRASVLMSLLLAAQTATVLGYSHARRAQN